MNYGGWRRGADYIRENGVGGMILLRVLQADEKGDRRGLDEGCMQDLMCLRGLWQIHSLGIEIGKTLTGGYAGAASSDVSRRVLYDLTPQLTGKASRAG
jgi:hypothetical protein